MICIKLNGGLGNQMFQYACAFDLSKKFNCKIVFDLSSLISNNSQDTKRNYSLNIFRIEPLEPSKSELLKLKPLHIRLFNSLKIQTGFGGLQCKHYFIEHKFSYNSRIKMVSPNLYLSGYWQSYKYFINCQKELLNVFKFSNNLNIQNLFYLRLINNSSSVSLHIRRTDFISKNNINIHGFCSLDYYHKAIMIMSKVVAEPTFFIFSDDIEWAKKNLDINTHRHHFVTGNIGENAEFDMHLMSKCKHNIIANSSFSWWGAWLNEHPNKKVIAPLQWFSDDKKNSYTNDLIPPSWIRV
jgi:hypothetical protein